jgi:hypothetical protein
LVGLTQENPGAVLAYSSISQMGWITVALGIGLLAPDAWPLVLVTITVYAAHHALAKSSLFLGLGVAERSENTRTRRLVLAGLVLGALAIAGAPLTSGAVAKYLLKESTEATSGSWPGALEALLQTGAVGTTLLMARFLFAVRPGTKPGKLFAGLWLSWAAQLVLITAGILALPGGPLETVGITLSFSILWPLVLGVALAGIFWWSRRGTDLIPAPHIPEGDLLVPLTRLLQFPGRLWEAGVPSQTGGWSDHANEPRTAGRFERLRSVYPVWLEGGMRYWAVAGLAFLTLILALVFAGLSL